MENTKIWIAVRVQRGLPSDAKVFYSRDSALKQYCIWRKKMNITYDDTEVFEVTIDKDKLSNRPNKS